MSEKGQLVVPRRIREKEGFKGRDRFVAIEVTNGVLFKRVEIPDVKFEFDSLSKDLRSHLRKRKEKSDEVGKAITWARKKQR